MKIGKILLASPFIAIGFIPLLFGGVMMLVAAKIVTLGGKKMDLSGVMDMLKETKKEEGFSDDFQKEIEEVYKEEKEK